MSQSIFAGSWYDLGNGWRMRMDGCHYEGEKPHVHVYDEDGVEVASENLDGTSSHGSSLNDLPNSIKKRVKDHPTYKKKREKVEKRSNIIVENVKKIQHAIDTGAEVVVIGGITISICVILDWAAKLGLVFLFAF